MSVGWCTVNQNTTCLSVLVMVSMRCSHTRLAISVMLPSLGKYNLWLWLAWTD